MTVPNPFIQVLEDLRDKIKTSPGDKRLGEGQRRGINRAIKAIDEASEEVTEYRVVYRFWSWPHDKRGYTTWSTREVADRWITETGARGLRIHDEGGYDYVAVESRTFVQSVAEVIWDNEPRVPVEGVSA